ncbi:hypothetical protein [Dyella sp.]|uniref:hypothetical protein n=1 Tax=Dyella sp. TaxID=1869338 RepID=UPI002B4795B5|nr:hypothetical protein [Dyella sp.]HKT26767.1 hypothetical protein [Dyella sp.]
MRQGSALLLFMTLFALGGGLAYQWLFEMVTSEAGVYVITDVHHDLLKSHALAAGAFGFFGLVVGIGWFAKGRLTQSKGGRLWILAGLAAVTFAAPIYWLFDARARFRVFKRFMDETAILDASLPVDAVPVYSIGLFSGLSVFFYVLLVWLIFSVARR